MQSNLSCQVLLLPLTPSLINWKGVYTQMRILRFSVEHKEKRKRKLMRPRGPEVFWFSIYVKKFKLAYGFLCFCAKNPRQARFNYSHSHERGEVLFLFSPVFTYTVYLLGFFCLPLLVSSALAIAIRWISAVVLSLKWQGAIFHQVALGWGAGSSCLRLSSVRCVCFSPLPWSELLAPSGGCFLVGCSVPPANSSFCTVVVLLLPSVGVDPGSSDSSQVFSSVVRTTVCATAPPHLLVISKIRKYLLGIYEFLILPRYFLVKCFLR